MLDDDAHNDTYKVSHRFMGIKEVSIVLLEGGDPNKLRDSIHQIIEKSAAAPTTSGRVGAILRKAKWVYKISKTDSNRRFDWLSGVKCPLFHFETLYGHFHHLS